ncbi:hypothetical protein OUZ56_016525 [Daphnia magna]|uniref:Uncharacterized protein n=1 Tax=Daphnia magna TaxID=35525 RepID=A0ABR0AR67_9CRUS|nr:hypothetical protein OUZ56_016525 [Daphnia magna]
MYWAKARAAVLHSSVAWVGLGGCGFGGPGGQGAEEAKVRPPLPGRGRCLLFPSVMLRLRDGHLLLAAGIDGCRNVGVVVLRRFGIPAGFHDIR